MRRDFDQWMKGCGLSAAAASLDDLGSLQGQRSADLAGTGGRRLTPPDATASPVVQRKAVVRTFVGTTAADAAHHNPSAPAAVEGLRAEVTGTSVLLFWASPAPHSLPVDYYEVRKGRTWAGGSKLGGNGNATFCFVFEEAAGLHQYWVAAVNGAGQVGPAAGILIYAGLAEGPTGEAAHAA